MFMKKDTRLLSGTAVVLYLGGPKFKNKSMR